MLDLALLKLTDPKTRRVAARVLARVSTSKHGCIEWNRGKDFAAKFGVSLGAVWGIIRGTNWKQL